MGFPVALFGLRQLGSMRFPEALFGLRQLGSMRFPVALFGLRQLGSMGRPISSLILLVLLPMRFPVALFGLRNLGSMGLPVPFFDGCYYFRVLSTVPGFFGGVRRPLFGYFCPELIEFVVFGAVGHGGGGGCLLR